MNRMWRNGFLLLMVTAVFAMFFGIGSFPLLDFSETIFAELARESLAGDTYIVSSGLSAYPFPLWPLGTWLTEASFRLFGVTEASARFSSALLGVCTVLLVAMAVTRLFTERAGLCAGFVLSSMVMLFYMGKIAAPETAFLFFITGTLLAFLQKNYLLMYLCFGLAFLVKGPTGLCLPAAVIFFYILLTGSWQRLLTMHLFFGLLLVLAVTLPWYVFLYEEHGPELLAFLTAAFSGLSGASAFPWGNESLWYYPLVLLVGLFPWTGIALKAVRDGFCQSRTEDMRKLIFFQIWWVVVLLFSLLFPVQDAGILLPLFPPLAVLIGWDLDRILLEEAGRFSGWAWRNGMVYLAAAAGWINCDGAFADTFYAGVGLAGLTLLFGIGIIVLLLVYKDGRLGVILQGFTGIVIMTAAFFFLLPLLQDHLSVRSLAVEAADKTKKTSRVFYAEPYLRPGILFYTGEQTLTLDLENSGSVRSLQEDRRPKYLFVQRENHDKIAGFLEAGEWRLLREQGAYCLLEAERGKR